MADLPAGTVTFFLTDVEGHARLWEPNPSAMRAGLIHHDAPEKSGEGRTKDSTYGWTR